MKKILVPTDFSICASKAIDYAIAICKRTGAELIILHSCELMDEKLENSRSYVQKYNQEVEDEANKKLEYLKSSILASNNIKITIKLYDGPVAATIIHVGQKYGVDLIVMGTHGASGLKQLIFGSQTASVISKCEIPVLAIPTDYHLITKGEILLAINHEELNYEELLPFVTLSKAFEMKVTLTTFTEQNKDQSAFINDENRLKITGEKMMKEGLLEKIRLLHITGDSLINALQDCIRKYNIDIVAMITHKREGLKKITNKSMTRKMAYNSNVPLLAIPHKGFKLTENENEYKTTFKGSSVL